MNTSCWACLPDGNVCRRPVVTVDPYRGIAVCARHAWWQCTNCETWNPVEEETCEDCGMPRAFSEQGILDEET